MFINRPCFRTAFYFSAGILIGAAPGISLFWKFTAFFALTLLFTGAAFIFKRNLFSQLPLAVLIIFLGIIRLTLTTQEFLPQTHLLNMDLFDSYVSLRGWITDKDEYSNGSTNLTVSLDTLTVRGAQHAPVEGKIRIMVQNPVREYGYGDEIITSGTLVRPSSQRNPGELNYREYLERKGIFAQLRVPAGIQVEFRKAQRGNGFLRGVVYPIQNSLSNSLAQFHSGQELEFLRAILLGQRSGLEPGILSDFRDTGTLHILAVSGLHVGFVVLIMQSFLSLLFIPRRWRHPVLIAIIFLYILVTGARPPVLRAGIFLMLFYFGMMSQRQRDPMNVLGITALVILLINPKELFDPGFQLSFCAVFGILYFMEIVKPRLLERTDELDSGWIKSLVQRVILKTQGMVKQFSVWWWAQNALSLFFMSIGAFLGAAIIMAYHFHRIAPGGMVLSVLFVPAAAMIVCLGFTEILAGAFIPSVAGIFGTTNDALIRSLFFINRQSADLPGMNFSIGHQEIIWAVLFILFILLAVMVLPMKLNHKIKLSFGAGAVMVVFGVWWTQPDGLMRVTFLDVGQGDAAVISFPDGSNWLVDGGNMWETGDAGERNILPFLRWAGIRHIDGIFLSHPNRDHYGGLASVIQNVRIDTMYESVDTKAMLPELELNGALLRRSVDRRLVAMGDVIGRKSQWRLYVLSPFIENQDSIEFNNVNDFSMILLFVYGETKFLFTGDISETTERKLVKQYGSLLDSNVLKVAHHGSKYSSSESFLQAVAPDYALISVGRYNTYGHPTVETLARLNAVSVRVFRTDNTGAVSFVSDGKAVRIIK